MGLGHKENTAYYRTLHENLEELQAIFQFNPRTGYFGTIGDSSNKKVRNIASGDPQETAKKFYDTATKGGKEDKLENGKGYRAKMKDGSVITWRNVSGSKDKSPAVSINISKTDKHGNIKTQKIHFVLKGED